jgi:hypothetical protein
MGLTIALEGIKFRALLKMSGRDGSRRRLLTGEREAVIL